VLIQHEENLMNRTLTALDDEWSRLNRATSSCDTVRRWGGVEAALAGFATLDDILTARTSPAQAAPVMSALARLGTDDPLAARCVLQALIPGLVRLAGTGCSDDPAAVDELVSLAWERIRTYPTSRAGSVAANVLWDVRKRYRKHRSIEAPRTLRCPASGHEISPAAEDLALEHDAVAVLHAACNRGVITQAALTLILRTRVRGEPIASAALEVNTTAAQANCIRWRAERRLRPIFSLAS
jgi:hypothetical protein